MSTIMVVDDMAVFREPIAAALRHNGYEAVCAANGKEALAVIEVDRPDLILLDVAMPEMDGLMFLKAMQGNPQLQDIPVILLTAVTERASIVKAAQLGADEYLLKSQFSLDEMLNRIRNRLERGGGEPTSDQEHQTDATQPDAEAGDAEETIDPETAGTFTEPNEKPPPVEGLEDVSDDMTASEIIEQIEESEELSALTSDSE